MRHDETRGTVSGSTGTEACLGEVVKVLERRRLSKIDAVVNATGGEEGRVQAERNSK